MEVCSKLIFEEEKKDYLIGNEGLHIGDKKLEIVV